MAGSILVTQSAGETFVIKTRHCGEIPRDCITVTADAKAYDEKRFEEVGENIVASLARPTTKSGETKKLRDRMETLLPRLIKASEATGGSGQFWFVAIFCKDQSMKYINAGQGLENGKVFISSNTDIHVSEFQSIARLKALASQNSYMETPRKKKIVEAGTPKLIVAKKRRVDTDQENNGMASLEDRDPFENDSEEEDNKSVVLTTPKKSAAMSRPAPSRKKLAMVVPEPNQLLPLAVMEYPTKGRGRGRGRPRKSVKASVPSGVGRGRSRGRGRPTSSGTSVGKAVPKSQAPSKSGTLAGGSTVEEEIDSSEDEAYPTVKASLPSGVGRGRKRGTGIPPSRGSSVERGVKKAWDIESMSPVREGITADSSTQAKAKRGTLAGGSTVARGKGNAKTKETARAQTVRNGAGGIRSKPSFMKEMRKAEEEIDTSEDEASPTGNEQSTRPTRASRRNLSNHAIMDLL